MLQRLCFLSEIDRAVDNYVPMYRATTRGQEDIALLALNSDDMDSFEGEKKFPSEVRTCMLSHRSTNILTPAAHRVFICRPRGL